MTSPEITQIISGFIGSLCFGILFNMRGKKLAASACGSLLSWMLFVLLSHILQSEPIIYFIVAAIISLYSEIMARIIKTPATPLITTSLIPLIPGGSLYYTMAYAFESDLDRFIEKAVYTLQLASSLAIGIIFITTLFMLVFRKKASSGQKS